MPAEILSKAFVFFTSKKLWLCVSGPGKDVKGFRVAAGRYENVKLELLVKLPKSVPAQVSTFSLGIPV